MMVFIYDLIVQTYFLSIKLAAFFNKKAKLWVTGRQDVFKKINHQIPQKRKQGQKLLWIHCASLGEFEQGRPVIEKIKKRKPETVILLTFFSPSGYEIRKGYEEADFVFYLPTDSRKNANKFMELINPDLAVFVKYEFWYHYLKTLRKKNIPTFLIAATFRKKQPFFRWWGKLHREMLNCFTKIFVQEKHSQLLLKDLGHDNVIACGDTRIDRVLSISTQKKENQFVEKFCGDAPILVCGSTWAADEKHLYTLMNNQVFSEWKMIIAPHDISEKRLREIEKQFEEALIVRHSRIKNVDEFKRYRILLIDNIGLLAYIYRYGRLAYVGGGFGAGIHNILEPLAFSIPVLFGPRHHKFIEAKVALKQGFGFSIGNGELIGDSIKTLANEELYTIVQKAATDFMVSNKGATDIIAHEIDEFM